ncbi:MAG: hypothetical protein ACP5OZ_03465 [Candidatus Woesearchaeota archaeon]
MEVFFLDFGFSKKEVKKIIRDFKIKTDVDQAISSEKFDVFQYSKKPYAVFILDCDACMKIACFPSIIGKELDDLTLECAKYAFNFLKQKNYFDGSNNKLLFYHILRASLGYNLHKVAKEKINFSEAWVRTKYVVPSYRDHDDNSKEVNVVFEDFSSLIGLKNKTVNLLVQDTVASGKTAFVALKRLFEISKEQNLNFDKIIFYGFISEEGMDFLWDSILKHNCNELIVLALGNLTPLCKNGYDMPLYGPDESCYSKSGELLNLGCIASEQTIQRWANYFIPGADQPGDWSERQEIVFTGNDYQRIDWSKYVNNSLGYLLRLKILLQSNYPWLFGKMRKRIDEEIDALKSKL